jgi:hypothetical protein
LLLGQQSGGSPAATRNDDLNSSTADSSLHRSRPSSPVAA